MTDAPLCSANPAPFFATSRAGHMVAAHRADDAHTTAWARLGACPLHILRRPISTEHTILEASLAPVLRLSSDSAPWSTTQDAVGGVALHALHPSQVVPTFGFRCVKAQLARCSPGRRMPTADRFLVRFRSSQLSRHHPEVPTCCTGTAHDVLCSCRTSSSQTTHQRPLLVGPPLPFGTPAEVQAMPRPSLALNSSSYQTVRERLPASRRQRTRHLRTTVVHHSICVAQHTLPADDTSTAWERGQEPSPGSHGLQANRTCRSLTQAPRQSTQPPRGQHDCCPGQYRPMDLQRSSRLRPQQKCEIETGMRSDRA